VEGNRGDKQAKPSPLDVSTAHLLKIFFGPASTLRRFNGSRHRRFNVKCRAREGFRSLDATPFSTFLIPGTSSVEHLRENVAGAGLQLPHEAIKELNAIAG
jgi:hypothetical protein